MSHPYEKTLRVERAAMPLYEVFELEAEEVEYASLDDEGWPNVFRAIEDAIARDAIFADAD